MGMSVVENGSTFRQKMQSRAANLRIGAQLRIVKYGIRIHQNLVAATPILTGKAKAEWQVGLNTEPRDEVLGSTRPPQEVDYEAYAAAAELELMQFQSGQTIYITNNTPYIADLNAGSSVQASANFVQAAVDEATEALRQTL